MRVGNVGLLNLLKATEESIAAYESIENAGLVLYNQKTAPLLTKLKIGNIGQTINIEDKAQLINGLLTIDTTYLEAIREPLSIVVNGVVVFTKDVTEKTLRGTKCSLIINGVVCAPPAIQGIVQLIIKTHSGSTIPFEGDAPIISNGKIELTDAFLHSLSPSAVIMVNGKLFLNPALDLNLFAERVDRLFVNGKALLHQEQETAFIQKASVNGKFSVIPSGFNYYPSIIKANSRSIRKFRNQCLYTTTPIVFEKDVSRNAFQAAFQSIHSNSYIICHEDIEDLIYESLHQFETDVYSYNAHLRYVDNEEWSVEEVAMLEHGTTVFVHEKLVLPKEIGDLANKDVSIVLLGELHVMSSAAKAAIQPFIQEQKGILVDLSKQEDGNELKNIGELTL